VYHLFVTAQSGTWDKSPYELEFSRAIREYTDEDLQQKYHQLDQKAIVKLLSFPALFSYEVKENTEARIGFLKNILRLGDEVIVKYDFFPNIPPLSADIFSQLNRELGIGKLEMYRTHWAVKAIDLMGILREAKLITKEQESLVSAHLLRIREDNPIQEMPLEDRRNSGLILLMLLAQTHYKMLECVISTSTMCTALDLELNHSYLWTIRSIRNLLKNHKDLEDFPIEFEAIFEDLYPGTIGDVDWQEMVAPKAEHFLSTVQRYTSEKGFYDPEKNSPAWAFVELLRPSINQAIERALAYDKRMRQHIKKLLPTPPQVPSDDAVNKSPVSPAKNHEDFENNPHSPNPKQVFISYSHKDKKFLDDLRTHLKPFERTGSFSTWSDLQIKPGSKWLAKIDEALSSAKVAVLLVTKDFLASDFIHDNELCPLLKSASQGDIKILWILIRDCNWKKTALKDLQAAYPTQTALARKTWGRDEAWVTICERIEEAASV